MTLLQIIAHYVETRRSTTQPVSIAVAVRAIRMVEPGCPLSDRELADLIAAAAVTRGFAIDFDAAPDAQPEPKVA